MRVANAPGLYNKVLAREDITSVLAGCVANGTMDETDAHRWLRAIFYNNALDVYDLTIP